MPVRLVPDERVGEGALMGLLFGAEGALYPHALVVACDMPFLNLSVLRYMVSIAEGHDVVVPRIGGWLEPLHAVYGKTCLWPMARLLARANAKLSPSTTRCESALWRSRW